MTKVRRIFDIAKELNISHIEIIDFLNGKDIKVTLMSAIPNEQYSDILENFQQEKNQVDRLRKEKARLNVIHHNQDKERLNEEEVEKKAQEINNNYEKANKEMLGKRKKEHQEAFKKSINNEFGSFATESRLQGELKGEELKSYLGDSKVEIWDSIKKEWIPKKSD